MSWVLSNSTPKSSNSKSKKKKSIFFFLSKSRPPRAHTWRHIYNQVKKKNDCFECVSLPAEIKAPLTRPLKGVFRTPFIWPAVPCERHRGREPTRQLAGSGASCIRDGQEADRRLLLSGKCEIVIMCRVSDLPARAPSRRRTASTWTEESDLRWGEDLIPLVRGGATRWPKVGVAPQRGRVMGVGEG